MAESSNAPKSNIQATTALEVENRVELCMMAERGRLLAVTRKTIDHHVDIVPALDFVVLFSCSVYRSRAEIRPNPLVIRHCVPRAGREGRSKSAAAFACLFIVR